jgi:hypothetical protein
VSIPPADEALREVGERGVVVESAERTERIGALHPQQTLQVEPMVAGGAEPAPFLKPYNIRLLIKFFFFFFIRSFSAEKKERKLFESK